MISVVLIVSTLFGYLLFTSLTNTEKSISLWIPSIILMLAVPLFLLWILIDTYYVLENGELKYVSGPIRGSIKIADIEHVRKNATLWVGLKPATARNGIIIKYEKNSELYISPTDNDLFIKKLLELNDEIKVIDKKW